MTYTQMISLLPEKDSPVETVGRGFFARQTSVDDRKKVLEFLLDNARYEQLFKLIYCGCINGHVNMENTGADYMAATGEPSNINTRYFTLFMQTIEECGIAEEKIVPLLLRATVALRNDPLYVWRYSSERYFTRMARSDYDRAWAYLREKDTEFKAVSILMQADREKTLRNLLELAVFGKGVNKVALRDYLRGYKQEVFRYVRPIYATLKTDNRIAAVRLLLPFRNDADVLVFLRGVAQTEKAQSILKLINGTESAPRKLSDNPDKRQVTDFFREAMVLGTAIPCDRFLQKFIHPPYAAVADSLFFSVYIGELLQSVVIVDGGRVLDLDNNPYILPEGSRVKVLHPVELNSKTEFIRRLNIQQPFAQIKRKMYLPSGADKQSNLCLGMAGTVIGVDDFKTGLRKLGFRMLSSDEGICRQVGLRRNGILCVLNVAPVDLSAHTSARSVQAQSVRFYVDKDVIRLGGKMIVDGVTPLSVARIDVRVFSEFMYSVYELMGLQ